MKFFVLTQRAEQDISDIWDYIADDNIEAIPNRRRAFLVHRRFFYFWALDPVRFVALC